MLSCAGKGRRHRAHRRRGGGPRPRPQRIPSLSLDLLYDIPGAIQPDWTATLGAELALEPDHLSLYALTLDDPEPEG